MGHFSVYAWKYKETTQQGVVFKKRKEKRRKVEFKLLITVRFFLRIKNN